MTAERKFYRNRNNRDKLWDATKMNGAAIVIVSGPMVEIYSKVRQIRKGVMVIAKEKGA